MSFAGHISSDLLLAAAWATTNGGGINLTTYLLIPMLLLLRRLYLPDAAILAGKLFVSVMFRNLRQRAPRDNLGTVNSDDSPFLELDHNLGAL